MTSFLLALFAALGLASEALAQPLHQAAEQLIDIAPDQETFHEMSLAAPDGDEEDRDEEETARIARIAELTKEYETAKSEISRAAALFERAKLHQERAFYFRDQAVQSYLAEYDSWLIGEAILAPEPKFDGWKAELLKRVNTLRDMAANFQRDPRIAEVNWQIATTMARIGNDHCEQYFKQAAQLSKVPEWAQRVRISRADWLVASGKLDEAISAYGQMRDGLPDDLKSYVTYRFGWAMVARAWKLAEKDRGDLLKNAATALKFAVVTSKDRKDVRFNLRSEAALALAWLWAVMDQEKDATSFFEKQGMAEMVAVFREKQADEWLRRGKTDKALVYYRAKITANPEDPLIPDIHLKLANAFVMTGNLAAMKQEIDAIGKITSV